MKKLTISMIVCVCAAMYCLVGGYNEYIEAGSFLNRIMFNSENMMHNGLLRMWAGCGFLTIFAFLTYKCGFMSNVENLQRKFNDARL